MARSTSPRPLSALASPGLVADLTAHSQGLPLVIGGLLITALPQAGIAEIGEGAGLTASAAGLAEQGQSPLEVVDGLAITLPQADFAQAGKGVSLSCPVAGLAEEGKGAVDVSGGLLVTTLPKVDPGQASQRTGLA